MSSVDDTPRSRRARWRLRRRGAAEKRSRARRAHGGVQTRPLTPPLPPRRDRRHRQPEHGRTSPRTQRRDLPGNRTCPSLARACSRRGSSVPAFQRCQQCAPDMTSALAHFLSLGSKRERHGRGARQRRHRRLCGAHAARGRTTSASSPSQLEIATPPQPPPPRAHAGCVAQPLGCRCSDSGSPTPRPARQLCRPVPPQRPAPPACLPARLPAGVGRPAGRAGVLGHASNSARWSMDTRPGGRPATVPPRPGAPRATACLKCSAERTPSWLPPTTRGRSARHLSSAG